MAGALLVGVVSHGATSARKMVASVIARQFSTSFINELAKLDVRCQLAPGLQPGTLESLRELEATLREEWLEECSPRYGAMWAASNAGMPFSGLRRPRRLSGRRGLR
jgi:hypothetical protein